MVKKIITAFSLAALLTQPAQAWNGLAVMGDSLSTGAAAHPSLAYDPQVLWRVFTGELLLTTTKQHLASANELGIDEDLGAPRRLWPSRRQNDGSSGWIWTHVIQAISRVALDTEEYSYGYLFGRSLKIPAQNIWIAGDNGSRADHAVQHADRILEAGRGELPNRVLMMFTGNDLCAQSWELITDSKSYGEGLYRAMRYLAVHGHNAAGESTRIYVPGYLPVTSLIHQESVLNKRIPFFGSEVSCVEARKRLFAPPDAVVGVDETPKDPRYNLFAQFMPPNPVVLCPTVFSLGPDDEEKFTLLANRVRAFRDAQKSAVEQFNQEVASGAFSVRISAEYLQVTEAVVFEGEDVGADCFHLSPRGHEKVAKALHSKLKE